MRQDGADRRRRQLEVFEAVVDIDDQALRARELARLCGDDARLRAAVDAMLAADASDAEPFSGDAGRWAEALTPEGATASTASSAEDAARNGETVGAWRITGLLGRGGMGAVYAAERADGAYAQKAALKRVHGGEVSASARERFLRERQVLARLKHPHIATLLDGGFDSAGDPYFVMERIEGEAIDRWCDARKLSLRERVTLFLQVLDAVQYAHRNLVVHRDLKPSNLLVTHDGEVKLLDFGIARELEAVGAAPTATADRAMTLLYASPEQLDNGPITTATDVFQLGVVLYRLLAGTHPFGIDAETPLAHQLQALSRDPEPLADGAREATPTTAAQRGETPDSLARAVDGSLAAIVHACLQREPAERYASVEALGLDLRAWLSDRPVAIARPGRARRTRLWLRRHRAFAASAAAVAVALLAGSGVALWQAHEARAQAAIAERESANARAALAFLTDTLAAASPEQAMATEVSVRDLLDHARGQLEAEGSTPAVRQSVERMLARLYHALGERTIARDLLASGLAGLRDDDASLEIADDLALQAMVLGELGEHAAATAAAERSAALRESLMPGDALQQLLARNTRATAWYHASDYPRAIANWQAALADAPAVAAAPVDTVVNMHATLAQAHEFGGDLDQALARADAGLAFVDARGVPAASPLRTVLLRMRAAALRELGDAPAALPVIQQAIAIQRAATGDRGAAMASLQNELGLTLVKLGRFREAAQLLESSDRANADAGLAPEDAAIDLANRAVTYESAGEYAKAVALFEDALAILRKAGFTDDQQRVRMTARSHANALVLDGRGATAEPLLDRLRADALAIDGRDSFEYAMTTWYLVQRAGRGGDAAEGLRRLDEAMALWPALVGPQHVVHGLAHRFRGRFARMQGDLALSVREYEAALARQQADAASPVAIASTRSDLAAVLAEAGDTARARRELAQALPVLRDAVAPGHVARAEAEALAARFGFDAASAVVGAAGGDVVARGAGTATRR